MEYINSFEGISVKGPLEHWSPLLRKWICLVNKSHSSINQGHICQLETSNISLLAAAAWTIGWVAIQECWVLRNKKSGKCDLWLQPIDSEIGEYIEGKIGWEIEWANDLLAAAESEVKNINIDTKYKNRRISICFIVPSIQKNQSDIKQEIKKNIIKSLQINYDAFAWCFPTKAINLSCQDDDYINPGLFLFAKMVN